MKCIMKSIAKYVPIFSIVAAVLIVFSSGPATAQAGQLYSGTSNPGIVYAYDGSSWTAISASLGFAVLDIIEFQGDLYAATMSSRYGGDGIVYRYDGGENWTPLSPTMDQQVCDLVEWDGVLYAGTAYSGGNLYRYNPGTESFDYVGTVDGAPPVGGTWSGIRAMYVWIYPWLQLGDLGHDKFGRFDGTDFYYDVNLYGSCIYDFAEFNNVLYAAAWAGRLLSSSDGINWATIQSYAGSNIWELEPFQGYLYMGNYSGNLRRLDASGTTTDVWNAPDDIVSMVADGDSMLYLGTGGEAGYYTEGSGTARVYVYYDGSVEPVEIFNADEINDHDHAGVQCLYLVPSISISVDIKPGSCPNPLNLKSKGVLPVAILGTEDLDVTTIDPDTIKLTREPVDCFVQPIHWSCEDVATPFEGELCDCHDLNGDGYMDLTLKFDTQELVSCLALEEVAGETIPLKLTGNLKEEDGGTPITGEDCVQVLNPGGGNK